MARACSICTHDQRKAIDNALVTSMPYRRIAVRFGVAETSLRRHAQTHLAKRLELATMWSVEELAAKLQALDADAQDVLTHGKQAGDHRLVLSGIEAAGRNIERLYKLLVGYDLEQRVRLLEAERDGDTDRTEQAVVPA